MEGDGAPKQLAKVIAIREGDPEIVLPPERPERNPKPPITPDGYQQRATYYLELGNQVSVVDRLNSHLNVARTTLESMELTSGTFSDKVHNARQKISGNRQVALDRVRNLERIVREAENGELNGGVGYLEQSVKEIIGRISSNKLPRRNLQLIDRMVSSAREDIKAIGKENPELAEELRYTLKIVTPGI